MKNALNVLRVTAFIAVLALTALGLFSTGAQADRVVCWDPGDVCETNDTETGEVEHYKHYAVIPN